MPEHLNQAVNTEAVDFPAHKVADPRLSHSEQLGGCGLSELLRLDQLRQLNHQIGSNLQILRFILAEPEIPEHISAGASDSNSHLPLLSLAPESFNLLQTLARQGS
jgi:hypothetical protein